MRAIIMTGALIGLTFATIAVGCGAGGGSGSSRQLGAASGGSSGATTGGGSGGATGGSGTGGTVATAPTDIDPPVITVASPARGAYLNRTSNPNADVVVAGTATDVSGVSSLTVCGIPVTPTANGNFRVTVPLVKGGNPIVVVASDPFGHVSQGVRSVVYAEAYDASQQPLPRALGARLTEGAFAAIGPVVMQQVVQSGVVQAQVLNNGQPIWRDNTNLPSWLGGGCAFSIQVTVQSMTFDTPTMTFDCRPSEIIATVNIPNLRVSAEADDWCGTPWWAVTGDVTATRAELVLGLALVVDPATGRISVSPKTSQVTLHGYNVDFTNLPGQIIGIFPVASAIRGPIERGIEDALRADVPPRVETELNGLFQPITRTWNGRTLTLAAIPAAITPDNDGLNLEFKCDVTAPVAPGMPSAPGAYFDNLHGRTTPLYAPVAPELSAAVLSNLWNRAFHRSWQASFWTFRIDQQFVNSLGINFPMSLSTQLIAQYVPSIAPLLPQFSIPIAIDLDPRCQPILLPTPNQPDLGRAVLPELHLSLLADLGLGNGYVKLFEFATHAEIGVRFLVRNGHEVAFGLGANPTFEAETLYAAIPLPGIDVGRMVSFLVPGALRISAQSIAPVPLASLSIQPLQLQNTAIQIDGQDNDYLLIEGDL